MLIKEKNASMKSGVPFFLAKYLKQTFSSVNNQIYKLKVAYVDLFKLKVNSILGNTMRPGLKP